MGATPLSFRSIRRVLPGALVDAVWHVVAVSIRFIVDSASTDARVALVGIVSTSVAIVRHAVTITVRVTVVRYTVEVAVAEQQVALIRDGVVVTVDDV